MVVLVAVAMVGVNLVVGLRVADLQVAVGLVVGLRVAVEKVGVDQVVDPHQDQRGVVPYQDHLAAYPGQMVVVHPVWAVARRKTKLLKKE